MRNISFDQLKIYLLVFLSIAVLIVTPMLYLEKAEKQKEYERFLNQFYHELDGALSQVDFILSSERDEHVDYIYNLALLDKRLERTYLTLEAGSHYVDRDITTPTYFFMNRIKLPQGNEELILEENELRRIKEALQYMKERLYSEETGQENKNITIPELNDILREGARLGE
ncbi:MAG: hypothetical protein H0Z33_14615 [Bacillaceae bacterium]|nr:hypothetical protein [Bacillaceae bacterium]